MEKGYLKIRVKIGDKEIEVSYPITDRQLISFSEDSTLYSATKFTKEIINQLKDL